MELENVDEKEYEINLVEIFIALKEKIILIILVTVIFGVVSYGATLFFVTPTYRSSFSLYVNNSTGDTKDTLTSSDISAAKSLANTYSEIIVSRSVLMSAADSVSLSYTYKQLLECVTAQTSSSTELITVYVTSTSPTDALRLAQAVQAQAEMQTASIVLGSSMDIVDEPVLPEEMYSPNYKKNTAIGALLGMFLACAVIVLRAITDDRIKDGATLEQRLGFAVMGTIPNTEMAEKSSKIYAAVERKK